MMASVYCCHCKVINSKGRIFSWNQNEISCQNIIVIIVTFIIFHSFQTVQGLKHRVKTFLF